MEFLTTSVPLAAYFVAANKLKLLRVEATPKTASLVFDDPDNQGSALELAFLADEALVPARSYNAQFRALRRAIEIKLALAREAQGANRG
jgi:hypothetical protein